MTSAIVVGSLYSAETVNRISRYRERSSLSQIVSQQKDAIPGDHTEWKTGSAFTEFGLLGVVAQPGNNSSSGQQSTHTHLLSKTLDYLSFLADDAAHLLQNRGACQSGRGMATLLSQPLQTPRQVPHQPANNALGQPTFR